MLPYQLKPIRVNNLVRIGPDEDGGYVLPSSVLHKTDILFGFGVCDDWRFEQDFQKRTGCQVICYDHTINTRFWVKKVIAYLSYAIFGVDTLQNLKNLLKPLAYRRFFDGTNAIYRRIKVGYAGEQRAGEIPSQSLEQILQPYLNKNVFLKVDIEGWEYRILDQLLKHPQSILGFVIEFHDVDLHQERIKDFISFLKSYSVVHAHANNFGSIDPNGNPTSLEITFVRIDLVEGFLPNDSEQTQEATYPIANLDFPNNSKKPDCVLNFALKS